MKFYKNSKNHTSISQNNLKKQVNAYIKSNGYRLYRKGFLAKIHGVYIDLGVFPVGSTMPEIRAYFWENNKHRSECMGQYNHLRLYRQPMDDSYIKAGTGETLSLERIKTEVRIKYFQDQLEAWCKYWLERGEHLCVVRQLGKTQKAMLIADVVKVYKNLYHVCPEFKVKAGMTCD